MKAITPIRAIRLKCRECQSNQYIAVKNCECPACPLFTYRHGKNPALKGKRQDNIAGWNIAASNSHINE